MEMKKKPSKSKSLKPTNKKDDYYQKDLFHDDTENIAAKSKHKPTRPGQ